MKSQNQEKQNHKYTISQQNINIVEEYNMETNNEEFTRKTHNVFVHGLKLIKYY